MTSPIPGDTKADGEEQEQEIAVELHNAVAL